MDNFQGATAFITGGSSGIGLGITKALAHEGAKVAFTYRRADHLEEAMAYFRAHPQMRVHPVKLEVTDREAMRGAAEEVERALGPVQLLVNNAGVGLRGPMAQATYDDWDWVLGVNVGGVVNGIVTFLPRMLASKLEGHIVNVSSLGGLLAPESFGLYTTSKFAVTGLTEGLANELTGTRVGVSVFLPGVVQTNMHEAAKSRPPHLAHTGYRQPVGAVEASASKEAMTPDEAALYVLDGIRRNKLFIFCNPEYRSAIEQRNAALLAAIPDPPVSEARPPK